MEKQFIAEGGIEVTDEMLDEWAKPYENGVVPGRPGGFVRNPGRPRTFEEPLRVVTLRLPVSIVEACDAKARKSGKTRSQIMREAIAADMLHA